MRNQNSMQLILHQFDLKLKYRFRIAHDSRDVQKTLIVELRDERHSGFGEATASKYYQKSIEEMKDLLEENRKAIEVYSYQDPDDFWVQMKSGISKNSFAQAALDGAVNDLYAKSKGISLIQLWGRKEGEGPVSNYTIGIDTVENMSRRLQEFPWPIYKIKLGTKEDIKIVRELRKLTDATFRVDANCGWEVGEALRNALELQHLGVEFIEQPLSADNWEGMKVLFQESPLPIIADESVISEGDIDRCKGYFHGVNIKLMKCGGMTPARRMIKRAKTLGMKVMVGCMTESSVGISAVAQLRPWLDYVDMDGSVLVENDIAQGPKLLNGNIVFAGGPGIGISGIRNTTMR